MLRLAVVILLITSIPTPGNVRAQTNYPQKPIRMIVGFPPGSQADTVGRVLGQHLAESMGQPIVIDNATGAAGNIAAERVAKAAPDGYTLGLLGEVQIVVNPSLYTLTYDPLKNFAPVSQIAVYPNMLVVHNGVPAKSVKELVALAKGQPGQLTFASGGSGSSPHMAAELFKSMAGLDIRHIPYKGVVVAMPDLLGERVTMMFSPIGIVLPLVRQGKLRALAVTSSKRSSAAPELPTIAESGYPNVEYTGWYGVLAPAMTSAAIVGKLHFETVKALALADLRAKLVDLGVDGTGNSPEEFAAIIKSEGAKWAKMIQHSHIRPD
jgi:tripartite-type tricarboxylate transporter receptor subunit TctC